MPSALQPHSTTPSYISPISRNSTAPGSTTRISLNSKLKKTKKKFTKMMDSYSKNGKYDIRLIKEDEFKFKCVEPSETEVYDKNTTITKKKDKKEKKEKKKKGKKIRG